MTLFLVKILYFIDFVPISALPQSVYVNNKPYHLMQVIISIEKFDFIGQLNYCKISIERFLMFYV